ncbi:MAG TPA: YihY/virulence factor BrkB family protein [Gaiellaceae bacterium]|jgi:membrane protein
MRELIRKFFADRGTHLAAMIAYFALLSFVPLVFLALALLGLAGRADESSFFVTELKTMFPGSSVTRIVDVVGTLQDNAATLGIVGGVFLLWTSLSLFSVLESAFNIVYGQPNRPFLRGKAIASGLLVGSLIVLFAGLVAGSLGFELLQRYAGGVADNDVVAYVASVAVSTVAVFVFLLTTYYVLTNVAHTVGDVLPGAVLAALLLQLTFQALPIYLRLSKDVVVLQALGGPVLLLVWLYVTANVIVFGAEINWWLSRGRREARGEDVPGLA